MKVSSTAGGGWTSRRRLLTALDGGIADRVPINTYELAGCDRLDWYNRQPSYQGLMEFIRAHTDCITNWNPRAGVDRYTCEERFLGSDHPVEIVTETERDGAFERRTSVCRTPRGDLRRVLQSTATVHTTWRVEHWCKSLADVDKALSVPYAPGTYDASDLGRVRSDLGDAGIVLASISDPAYLAADLMSFQDFLMWAAEETGHFARTVDILAERVLENLRRQLDCCVVDCYRIVGPEYFTPPYLSPAMFRRFVVPHVKAMTELIHGRGAKVRLHCHGRIGRVLDMILETGCDGIDPCEPPPDGDIEIGEVKRRCSERGVSVWGNIELKVLEQGTAGEVRAEVRKILDQAKAGGGFVLMPTAAPIDVPLSPRTEANYRAFIEAGLEYGGY
ncbi:MAG TPA: uroporphyrinogen decarboxylase family protein [Verrucomicrobiota bacterium]|nr:uroporphyrinogen decarboxylase family protein [Verrucomicrobiota bacterium]HNU49919.1 uroporphyrinogen decarboxylase family protein [Verrucomicrobiota bacterium]